MNELSYIDEKQCPTNLLLDAWIEFLISLKGKGAEQIQTLLGMPDNYFGISTVSYQGSMCYPQTVTSAGTYSIILENGFPRHISLTAPAPTIYG